MKVVLSVNQRDYEIEVRTDEYLLETLRRLNFYSVKKGCDTSSCGVCTLLCDGKPIASCSYLSLKAQGHEITTVEGIEEEAKKIAGFMGHEGADQCGYCNPGFALTVFAMKTELKDPTDEDIRNYLVGNLCRCSGYVSQHKAIKNYLEVR